MARRYQAYQYNLFGDPATDLKSAISTPIDLDLPCSAIVDAKVEDISTNGNHAFVHGDVDTLSLLGSKALSFGGNDSYLTVPHNAWNPMGNQLELTLAGWFYIDSLYQKTGLFVKGDEESPFALYLSNTGRLRLELNKNSPSNAWKSRIWISDFQLKQKGLYHLAMVMEYSTMKAYFYVDGQLRGTATLPDAYLLGATEAPLYIGKDPYADKACFQGFMDDIKVYSRSLSEAEVRQVMGKEKPATIAHTYIIDAESSQAVLAYAEDKRATPLIFPI